MSELKQADPAPAASANKKEKKKGQNKFAAVAADGTASAAASASSSSSHASSAASSALLPAGTRKDLTQPMADAYHPSQVESSWDAWWTAQGLYKPLSDHQPDLPASHPTFTIVIPPPNVTGTLHLGHALTCSIEDAVVRWHRMLGHNTLWIPGTDHAGIATQVVVEKKLMRDEGLSRHTLGRDAFIERVWEWKRSNGDHIARQTRRLGASVDWSREAFTMDDARSRAVQQAFITMHSRGLIYRSNRLVNWSCALRTAISSIEVDYQELEGATIIKVPGYDKPVEFGVIHSFAYRVKSGSGQQEEKQEEIVVATTRIETMLGDVAVAVHPRDPRYTHLHGKSLEHPFLPDRTLRVVCDDELVDMAFGTGAVKVTPAHDPNDFKCGQRHALASINIFTDDGHINHEGGPFTGLKRFDARTQIIERLQALGLYRGKAGNKMSLGLCSRSKDIVEPVVRPQWWVNCAGMAQKAVQSVRQGQLKIIPNSHEKVWFHWLENIQDWCISRQLWWGHRIPAYHISVPSDPSFSSLHADDNHYWLVARSLDEATTLAMQRFPQFTRDQLTLTQDPDVLDTWFSSGLFPFSTQGWPDEASADLARFYPTSLLETGHDILFFWVARMVMMALELTGRLPFDSVYLHAMVRDKFGRKMSKSLGNVVDPIDVITGISLDQLHHKLGLGNLDPAEVDRAVDGQKRDFPDGIAECGADALRFGLLAYSSQGRDVNLDIQRVVAYRQFGNKLWQATRFALLSFDAQFTKPQSLDEVAALVAQSNNLADRWILSRLAAAVKRANDGFTTYEFAECTTACHAFWLYDLCDVYLELIKPIVRADTSDATAVTARQSSLAVLYTCLNTALRLLHPLMPFITEELYHRLPHSLDTHDKQQGTGGPFKCGSIMVASYPTIAEYSRFDDSSVEQQLVVFQQIAHSARSTRSTLGLTKKRVDMYLLTPSAPLAHTLQHHARDIATLSYANCVTACTDSSVIPAGSVSSVINLEIEVHIPLKGLVDFGAELVKMEKQQTKLQESVVQLQSKQSAAGYEKTKAEIRDKDSERLGSEQQELTKLQASIDNFHSLMSPDERTKYNTDKLAIKQADADRAKASMDKLLAGGDPTKLAKKILAKYEEAKREYDTLCKEIHQLQLDATNTPHH